MNAEEPAPLQLKFQKSPGVIAIGVLLILAWAFSLYFTPFVSYRFFLNRWAGENTPGRFLTVT